MVTAFTRQIIAVVRAIPAGKVATYGQVAALAGYPPGARQVAWTLHSSSEKKNLPWHRVVTASGRIALAKGEGLEEQVSRLRTEGVRFQLSGKIDLKRYLWKPRKTSFI